MSWVVEVTHAPHHITYLKGFHNCAHILNTGYPIDLVPRGAIKSPGALSEGLTVFSVGLAGLFGFTVGLDQPFQIPLWFGLPGQLHL